MATIYCAACIAIGAFLSGGMPQSDSRLTVLVYNYSGLRADILLKAEEEAARIMLHSGVDITWRPCRVPDSMVPLDCPEPSAMTPAVRLVPRFQAVANRVHVEAMGFCTGDFATVSVEFAQRLEEAGVSPLLGILGHAIAHEIGHLLLPGNGHSVSGIMRARWDQKEWMLLRQGNLNFTPEQARLLRAGLLNRAQTMAKQTR